MRIRRPIHGSIDAAAQERSEIERSDFLEGQESSAPKRELRESAEQENPTGKRGTGEEADRDELRGDKKPEIAGIFQKAPQVSGNTKQVQRGRTEEAPFVGRKQPALVPHSEDLQREPAGGQVLPAGHVMGLQLQEWVAQ